MNQTLFESSHRQHWQEFDAWLKTLAERQSVKNAEARGAASRAWPQRYREIASHLALARDRAYSPELVDYLSQLALRGHQALYGARSNAWNAMVNFIGHDFPVLVRKESRLVWFAMALLFVPLIAMIAVLQVYPEFVYYLVSPEQVRSFEQMYAPDNRVLGPQRSAGSQVSMFGFYIWNNVKIDFQCFAGGMLYGVGTIFFLLFNGFNIGAVAGHLTHLGYIETFWGFCVRAQLMGVVGRGAFRRGGVKARRGVDCAGAFNAHGRVEGGCRARRAPAVWGRGHDGVCCVCGGVLVFDGFNPSTGQIRGWHCGLDTVRGVLYVGGAWPPWRCAER